MNLEMGMRMKMRRRMRKDQMTILEGDVESPKSSDMAYTSTSASYGNISPHAPSIESSESPRNRHDTTKESKTQSENQVTQGAALGATGQANSNDNVNDNGNEQASSLDKTISLVNTHIQNTKLSLSDMNDVSHLKHYLLAFLDISDIIQSVCLINKHWHKSVTLKSNDSSNETETNLIFWKKHLFNTFKHLSILRNANDQNSVFYAKYGKSEWYKEFEYYDKNVAIMACEENNDNKEFEKMLFYLGYECHLFVRCVVFWPCLQTFELDFVHNPYYEECVNHKFYAGSQMHAVKSNNIGLREQLGIRQSTSQNLEQTLKEDGLLDEMYGIHTVLKVIDYVSTLVSKLEKMNEMHEINDNLDDKRLLFGQLFSVFNWFNVVTLNYHSSLVKQECGEMKYKHKSSKLTSFSSQLMFKYLLLTFGNKLDNCDGLNGKNYKSNMGNENEIENGLSWHGFIFRLKYQCDIMLMGRTFPYDVTDYNEEKIDRSQCFKNEAKDFSFELLHSRAMIRKILFNNDYTWENTLGIWRNSLLLEMYAFNNERFLNNVDLFDAYIGDKCLKLVNKRLSPFITGVASFIQGRMHHKTMIVIDYLLFLKQFKQYPNLINEKTFEYSSLIFNSVTEWDSTHSYRMLKSDELSIDALTTLKGLKNISHHPFNEIYPLLTAKRFIKIFKTRSKPVKFDC